MIDPFAPQMDQINIDDIVHSLSLQCRFNGHTQFMYSVARHCIYVAEHLEREGEEPIVQMCGLLHDAAEAYLCDIPTPIKMRPEMEFYRQAEERLLEMIAGKFDLPWPFPQVVWDADKIITQSEAAIGRYTFDATNPVYDQLDFSKKLHSLSALIEG